ncbi:MAG: sulfatase-like hydrolase/transferase, partial [Myxococcota bacterium]
MSGRRVSVGPILLILGILVVGVADAVVIALTTGYFGGGYNSPALRGASGLLAFAGAGAVQDAFLLATGFAVASTLARLFSKAPDSPARIAFASALALFVPLAFDVFSRALHRVFGQVLGVDLLVQLAGGRLSDAALEAMIEAPATLLVVGGALAGLVIGARMLRRLEPAIARRVSLVAPSQRRVWVVAAASGALGAVILGSLPQQSPTLAYGLESKASGQLLILLVRAASDVDRDGFGLLSRPPDPDAWDGGRHPFAREIAGNGIDENGIGGDLPANFEAPLAVPVPARLGPERPSFLIVFLESFRGDLLGMRLAGQEVTPTLNRLAREGASSAQVYAHNPLTWPSRAQLFQGRLRPMRGAPTLIDDFRKLGYRVAYFSGQDDSHGGSEALVGFDRAHVFQDARSDTAQRTSRTALPVSLQVPWQVVLGRVRQYLDQTQHDPRPLFLYVNLVDNHYPYHHEQLERLLGVEPVGRSEIRPENARRVLETYLQAATNVDRAVDFLVAMWRERMGPAPLIVTADHGQSFYENGILGHGQTVDEAQSRVPLVVVGIGGTWPEPLGLADLRGLLLEHLFEAPGKPHFSEVPERVVFQYTGPLARPRRIALRGVDGVTEYQFDAGRAMRGRNGDPHIVAADDGQVLAVI